MKCGVKKLKNIINIFPEGRYLHCWYRNENNELIYEKDTFFKPYFYASNEKKGIIEKREDLQKIFVSHPNKVREEREKYEKTYEADVLYVNRYLIDKFPEEIQKSKLRIFFLDIETEMGWKQIEDGDAKITSISFYDNYKEKTYTFSWGENPYKNFNSRVIISSNEQEMMDEFLVYLNKNQPDVITGWNIDAFDIPYIIKRFQKFEKQKELSPIKIVSFDKFRGIWSIAGVAVLDYLWLYKKYVPNKKESYSLDYIAKIEGLTRKMKYEGTLDDLRKNEFEKYIEYNRMDCQIVKEMEDKFKFIELSDELRRISKVPFEFVLQNSKIVDSLLISLLNKKGFVAQTAKKVNKELINFEGAYVQEPKKGLHDWIIDNDFTSLYPFIIINFNISPETKSNEGEIISPNGIRFTKDKEGIIPEIIKWLFEKRVEYKNTQKKFSKEKNENEARKYFMKQWAFKILLNSIYGFMGFEKSRFFDIDLASSITSAGRELIKFAIEIVEEKGYVNVATDTDSVLFSYSTCKDKEEAKRAGKEVAEEINKRVKIFCKEKFNIDNCTFNIKQEIVARKGLFIAKKRYVLWIVDEEGIERDELKVTGFDTVRSDTPEIAREFLLQILEKILKGKPKENIFEYVKQAKKTIQEAPKELIGLPITLTKGINNYKNLPIHVRGVNYYNKYFEPKILQGNRIKYYYIKKVPHNYEKSYVISIPQDSDFPDGFEIDMEKMVERLVDKKIENVFEALDWKMVEENNNIW